VVPAVIPREIRDNNPGGIRHSGVVWQGQRAAQTDPGFVQFNSPLYGLRALAIVLLEYQLRHGLRTLSEIIERWAPPSDDNDTVAYIDDVSTRTGLLGDKPLDLLHDPIRLACLCKAIVRHETGEVNVYSDTLYEQAVSMALAHVGVPPTA
jgi:hypothetical protein